MKRMLTLFVLVCCLFGANTPVAADGPYVGFYADAYHSAISVYAGMYMTFDVWLWWLPGPGGLQWVECGFEYPSSVVRTGLSFNPDVPLYIVPCCTSNGCSCGFMSCHNEWVYLFRETCMLMSVEPCVITITGHPETGGVSTVTCDINQFPVVEQATILNHLSINQPGEIGVETSSWGAIKGLYR